MPRERNLEVDFAPLLDGLRHFARRCLHFYREYERLYDRRNTPDGTRNCARFLTVACAVTVYRIRSHRGRAGGVAVAYDTFAEAAYAYADLVRGIPPEAWTRPGLGEWTVRDLVGHTSRSLITVETYLARPAAFEQVASSAAYYVVVAKIDPASVAERGREAGRALGEDPVRFVDALVARVLPLAKRDDDPLLETAAGGMRLTNYLPTRTFELVVHGYDIATATGLASPSYSAEVLNEVVALAGAAAVATGRALEVIRAFTGRAALPTGFSVV